MILFSNHPHSSGLCVILLINMASFSSSFTPCPLSVKNLPKNSLKAKKSSETSPWDPIIRILFQDKSAIESGVETAALLLDKRQQSQCKKDIRKEFRWIPAEILDVCFDSATAAFATVAPSELKAAIKQGGLQKVRPKLEDKIVKKLESRPIFNSFPFLKLDDRRQLLTYLVSLSLDYLLKDAEKLLANPFDKLRLLDKERRKIRQKLTFRQLAWYRLRFYPGQMFLLGVTAFVISYGIYVQHGNNAILPTVSKISTVISSLATNFWMFLNTHLRKHAVCILKKSVEVAIEMKESLW